MSYKPPFTVTADAISLVAEISALAERYAIRLEQSDSLRLRKTNRIRTIRSTLAIEGSTLSIGQVTAILNGKHVIAPPREIREVQNAVAVYDLYSRFDPFSVDDLLKAHAGMTDSLVEHPGRFRTRSVGVAAGYSPGSSGGAGPRTDKRFVPLAETLKGSFADTKLCFSL